ncbi:MAGE domain-containing protein [Aspergillus brunneoviolaceus CBS 621.78]|uniref:MAGE family protein n=1 Tax=Aspergillus brunneoviolaceus CBS 621.78 TaxID=1450534 RepID=A0ACD1G8H0_9EURO|nr:MAGE family protein [Aspergillus brunneoviolaceus CBS 621.78]RAH45439.1 MAGE family protein [Aspergillus brunneoviolaceus CBS 621.78]
MPPNRKRRAAPENESSEEVDGTPPPTQNAPRRRRRDDSSSSEGYADEGYDIRAPTSTDVMVKKLVRLALATEYSRQPLRRIDISAKVLGEQGARQFRTVFDEAQRVLGEKFGMQMTELPVREKVTVHQRRAAQKVEKASSGNKNWILTSLLPPEYRRPAILRPSKAPLESTYTGLYSFIIAVILLNGGTIQEQKLDRYLQRTNTNTYTPVDRTDRFLQRLCKEGYLVRNRDVDGGEEVIEYILGPRGKVEVGAQGVAGLVREVYGQQDADEPDEELEIRLARSLGLQAPQGRAQERPAENTPANEEDEGQGPRGQRRQQPRRRGRTESGSEGEESD